MYYILLILNFSINWLLITAIATLIIGSIFPNTSWVMIIILSTSLLIGSIMFFMSETGNHLLRSMIKCRLPSNPEVEYLRPVFKEVFSKVNFSERPEVFIKEDKNPNAMALAGAIIITTGLLEFASKEELKAVIAHEAGHIANGDVKIKTLHYAVNKMGNAMLILTIGLIMVLSDNGRRFYIFLPFIILAVTLKIIYWILNKIVKLGVLSVDRNNEYRADAYAASIGYKEPIISYLKKISSISKDQKTIFSTHPTLISRIAKLE